MLVTYVDRCAHCACSTLRDDAGRRPVPGLVTCGKACRCHAPVRSARAVVATLGADAARFRLLRRRRVDAPALPLPVAPAQPAARLALAIPAPR